MMEALGDVAQSVEHLLCKQGVGGSSPLVSTTTCLVGARVISICDRAQPTELVVPGIVPLAATCRVLAELV
jgi:hypothetical protein